MKILAIGDPHGNLDKIKQIPIKEIDLILVTGDLGSSDRAREVYMSKRKYTAELYKDVHMEVYDSSMGILKYLAQHAPTYVIFGNVGGNDNDTIKQSKKFKIKLPLLVRDVKSLENVYILRDKFIDINGMKIGGLEYFVDISWVEEFSANNDKRMKAAVKDTKYAKQILDSFGKLDILMCHQPPFGILDKVDFKEAPLDWQGKHAGSKVILEYVKEYQPRYVVCGHIHEGYGTEKVDNSIVHNLGVAEYEIIEL